MKNCLIFLVFLSLPNLFLAQSNKASSTGGSKNIDIKNKSQSELINLVFQNYNTGKLAKGWKVVGSPQNNTVNVVHKKNNNTAGINCGCCSIVIENGAVRCGQNGSCTDCKPIIVTPLPTPERKFAKTKKSN